MTVKVRHDMIRLELKNARESTSSLLKERIREYIGMEIHESAGAELTLSPRAEPFFAGTASSRFSRRQLSDTFLPDDLVYIVKTEPFMKSYGPAVNDSVRRQFHLYPCCDELANHQSVTGYLPTDARTYDELFGPASAKKRRMDIEEDKKYVPCCLCVGPHHEYYSRPWGIQPTSASSGQAAGSQQAAGAEQGLFPVRLQEDIRQESAGAANGVLPELHLVCGTTASQAILQAAGVPSRQIVDREHERDYRVTDNALTIYTSDPSDQSLILPMKHALLMRVYASSNSPLVRSTFDYTTLKDCQPSRKMYVTCLTMKDERGKFHSRPTCQGLNVQGRRSDIRDVTFGTIALILRRQPCSHCVGQFLRERHGTAEYLMPTASSTEAA